MKYRIVQYIQPWEIDDLLRQTYSLIESRPTEFNNTIIVDVTMNVSNKLVNWKKSKIPKQYFLEKFRYIETLLANHFSVEFDTDATIQGVVDKRRECAKKRQDFTIWLDPDIFFPVCILSHITSASQCISDSMFIISPQIIKYWDSSWDCITNENYLKEKQNMLQWFDSFSVNKVSNPDSTLIYNDTVKIGGGLFNLFSDSLLKRIPIPKALGSYGLEDTYMALCSMKLNVQQYLLKNIIVTESSRITSLNKNYFKDLISKKRNQHEVVTTSEELHNLVQNFT